MKAVTSAEELYFCDVVSLHIPATAETKNSINYALVGRMPKGGLLVNTARKEVINEAELIQLMEERADLKYMTDIMPAALNETFAAKFAGRYFSTPKRWVHGLPKPISTQVLLLPTDCRLPERRLREVRVNKK